jgi:heme exporter protein D
MSAGGLSQFLEMGGYALYVWGSYAMVAAGFAWEVLTLLQRRRRALQELRDEAAPPVAPARAQ